MYPFALVATLHVPPFKQGALLQADIGAIKMKKENVSNFYYTIYTYYADWYELHDNCQSDNKMAHSTETLLTKWWNTELLIFAYIDLMYIP